MSTMFRKRVKRLVSSIHPSTSGADGKGDPKSVSCSFSKSRLTLPHAEPMHTSHQETENQGGISVVSEFELAEQAQSNQKLDLLASSSALNNSLNPLAAQLKSSAEQFFNNYSQFLSKHKQFIKPEEEVQCAIRHAKLEDNIWDSAKTFENELKHVIQVKSRKEGLSKTKWRSRLGHFITALFPVARVSLQFTGAIAEVLSLSPCYLLYRAQALCLSKVRQRALESYYR